MNDGPSDRRVSPFGHLRINPCQQVPAAFRRLPRPSSPVEAKASPGCPFAALVPNGTIAIDSLAYNVLLLCVALSPCGNKNLLLNRSKN